MSNIMMNPILPGMASGAPQEVKNQVKPGSENSFMDFMDKKLQAERSEKKNLLGAKERPAAKRTDTDDQPQRDPASVAGALQQLMADLQKLVKQPDTDVGEWRFELKNLGLLDKLAAPAGMNMTDLALLKKQMEEQGSLALADLFAVLQKHFQGQGEEQRVTVAETDLPLLESLLSRMGVAADKLSELSDQGVSGLGELDLQAYLQGLRGLAPEELNTTVLTDWELEQLQLMLQEAGVGSSQLAELFPEQLAMWQRALTGQPVGEGDGQVELNLARLQELLEQAIAATDAGRSKTDLPGFLGELHNLLAQTGKQSTEVGWSPVIQESITAIYQELQKMINLAEVKVEKVTEMTALDEDLAQQWLASGEQKPLDPLAVKEGAVLQPVEFTGGEGNELELELGLTDPALAEAEDGGGEHGAAKLLLPEGAAGEDSQAEQLFKLDNDRVHQPRIRLTPEAQQFATEQISQGVLRGLRNNDHHLTLTLYPKELGEVKVDMQVRDSQLTLTFVMENSKVKEALESNMQEFRDNLERKGFSLEGCAVSVGQDDADEKRRLFEMAWEKMIDGQRGEKETGLMAQPSAMADGRAETLRQGSISVFV